MQRRNVIVVGAGPVGTVAALACARRGLSVTLLEAQTRIDDSPRASTTQPPTLEILAELGLIDEYLRVGLVSRTFQFWDRPKRRLIAEFDFDRLKDETAYPFVVQTEQHKLANMAIARLSGMANAEVRMGSRVVGVVQDENQASVQTAENTYAADYAIAADGGRSAVRKALDIEFEGYTWPERFLVITTKFDFQAALGCCLRNYMADPREWTNLFKVAGDDLKGRWRAVFNTREEETDEEALSDAAVRARLSRVYVPEASREYLHLNLYAVHQRVAKSFRKGRVFLCGDAAHVNNPIGGLGLNSGIHEAWHLAELLSRASRHEPVDLDAYERTRRPLNIKYVQEQTVANKKRLEERDPAARERRFRELGEMADDPRRHKAFLMRASLLESSR
ncbi:MAG TPA: NAD(P)/FAD-dependent oxidoreductase [Burkholderiales bacterium]|jgi:3-(3-hydroxy-phenyl)propionate hydroxylase|nr:NAD(P)/FAD-dependent oxidoreductase [Burkholderiales bacterium]